MISEPFSPDDTKSICFTFWYHSFGSAVGSLNIYIADTNNTKRSLIWGLSGQQSLNQVDWKQGVMPITNIQDNYIIVIEGVVGDDFDGDIR